MCKDNYICALKEIQRLIEQGEKPNFSAIAEKNDVNRKTLRKMFDRMVEKGLKPRDFDLLQERTGRPTYLDKSHEKVFNIVLKSCDVMGDPLTEQGISCLLFDLAKHQRGPQCTPPCRNTIKKYIKNSSMPLKSVRSGEDIRTQKSKPEYLLRFFNELKELVLKHNLGPSQIWNADECGVKVVDARLRVATSRANIRMQFKDLPHLTAMLASSASGVLASTLLIYPPSTVSETVLAACQGEDILCAVQENSYMDVEIFRSWLHHFIIKVKSK